MSTLFSCFRFAQFFVCPLFTESATDREINAVNHENQKNMQNDGWRIRQLQHSLSKPGHDFLKFATGQSFPYPVWPIYMEYITYLYVGHVKMCLHKVNKWVLAPEPTLYVMTLVQYQLHVNNNSFTSHSKFETITGLLFIYYLTYAHFTSLCIYILPIYHMVRY